MKEKKRFAAALVILVLVASLSFCAEAATSSKTTSSKTTSSKKTSTTTTSKKKRTVKKWVEKNGRMYYTINGKVQKRLVTIGKKSYYFSARKGIQRTGWRHIGNYYYYFRQVPGKGGYMLKNCRVDGIKLNKKGRAVVKSADALRKVSTMQKYQKWSDGFIRCGMSDAEKLYACLNQLRSFHYRNEPDNFSVGQGNWDVICAEQILQRKEGYWPTAECYRFACGFCYLANAVGLRDVRICAIPGHGWSMINGVVYDATRVINRGSMVWFPVDGSLLGEYTPYFVTALN